MKITNAWWWNNRGFLWNTLQKLHQWLGLKMAPPQIRIDCFGVQLRLWVQPWKSTQKVGDRTPITMEKKYPLWIGTVLPSTWTTLGKITLYGNFPRKNHGFLWSIFQHAMLDDRRVNLHFPAVFLYFSNFPRVFIIFPGNHLFTAPPRLFRHPRRCRLQIFRDVMTHTDRM